MKINDVNIDQRLIIEILKEYREANNYTEFQEDEEGLCHGLTALYLYKGKEWLEQLLKNIIRDNVSKYGDRTVIDYVQIISDCSIDVEKLMNHVSWLQQPREILFNQTFDSIDEQLKQAYEKSSPPIKLQSAFRKPTEKIIPELISQHNLSESISFISTDNDSLAFLTKISFIFQQEELKTIFDGLRNKDLRIALESYDHSVGLTYHNNKFYIYDPNGSIDDNSIEIECANTDQLVRQLHSIFISNFNINSDFIPLSITVYCNFTSIQSKLAEVGDFFTDTLNNILDNDPASRKIQVDDGFINPYHLAVSCNDPYVVIALLKNGTFDLELKDNHGFTPLLLAAHLGRINIFNQLINARADILAENRDGNTVLHFSVDSLSLEMIHTVISNLSLKNELINLIAKKNKVEDKDFRTPLHNAARRGLEEIVKVLISHGADINDEDGNGNDAIYLALENGHISLTLKLLEMCDYQFNSKNNQANLLHLCVEKGSISILKILVEKRSELINEEDDNDLTPLDRSVLKANDSINILEIIDLLFENTDFETQYRALIMSIKNEKFDKVSYLIGKFDKEQLNEKLQDEQSDEEDVEVEAYEDELKIKNFIKDFLKNNEMNLSLLNEEMNQRTYSVDISGPSELNTRATSNSAFVHQVSNSTSIVYNTSVKKSPEK